ncbi:MAG: hypothetical protein WCO66_01075 [Candidatus Absconditabacteria bacterium]
MKKSIIGMIIIIAFASCNQLNHVTQNNVSTTFYNKSNYNNVNRNGVHQTEKKVDPPKPTSSYAQR